MKKAENSKGGEHGSLASRLKSGGSSEATAKDLVVYSGSTDHVIVNKNWFKNLKEIETTVTNPDGGNTNVLGIGESEVLAKDVKGKTKSLVLRKALFVPGYRTSLISVSRIVDNGHTVVHDAKIISSASKAKRNSHQKKMKSFLSTHDPKARKPLCEFEWGVKRGTTLAQTFRTREF